MPLEVPPPPLDPLGSAASPRHYWTLEAEINQYARPVRVSLGLVSTGTHSTGTTGTAAAQEAGARGDGRDDGESAATTPPTPKARSAAAECHGQLTPDPGPKHGEREGAARQPLPIP